MAKWRITGLAAIIAIMTSAMACNSGGIGPLSAPEECPFSGGGSADETIFARHFS